MGRLVEITLNQFNRLINELHYKTYQNAANSAFEQGDNRAKKFRNAASDAFDKDARPYYHASCKRQEFDDSSFQAQHGGNSITFFDGEYKSLQDLYDGVKRGELLIHARRMQGEPTADLEWIYPTFDETMKQAYGGDYEEAEREPAEMIFASDDFSWAKNERNGVFFVRSDNFAKSLGNDDFQLPDGTICKYYDTPLYDYDDDRFRDVPWGVEHGDWVSKDEAEVVAILNLNN